MITDILAMAEQTQLQAQVVVRRSGIAGGTSLAMSRRLDEYLLKTSISLDLCV
jgi:hypothetical protein